MITTPRNPVVLRPIFTPEIFMPLSMSGFPMDFLAFIRCCFQGSFNNSFCRQIGWRATKVYVSSAPERTRRKLSKSVILSENLDRICEPRNGQFFWNTVVNTATETDV